MRIIKGFSALCAAFAVVSATGSASAQEKYIGEVFATAASYCPSGTLEANGATMQIMNYQALYSLLGVTYGGDGVSNFRLPDLRGRSMIGLGTGPGLTTVTQGATFGQEQVALTIAHLPNHSHSFLGGPLGNTAKVGDAAYTSAEIAAAFSDAGQMAPGTESGNLAAAANSVTVTGTIGNTGNSQPFSVRDPALGMRFCIVSTDGIYPSRP